MASWPAAIAARTGRTAGHVRIRGGASGASRHLGSSRPARARLRPSQGTRAAVRDGASAATAARAGGQQSAAAQGREVVVIAPDARSTSGPGLPVCRLVGVGLAVVAGGALL